MTVSVIIPADTEGCREAQLALVMAHIHGVLPDAEVIVSRGPAEPFNKSAVCNSGAWLATCSTLLFVDADMLHLPAMLKRAAGVRTWGVPTGEVRNLLEGEVPGGRYGVRAGVVKGRGGLFAFRRIAFERVGGFDEGYVGWGCEDEALYIIARAALGEPEDLGSEASWHLHHEPQPERATVRRSPLSHNKRRLAELIPGGYMKVKVTNTGHGSVCRGAMVFRGGSVSEIVVSGDSALREIRACRHLNVTVLEDKTMTNVETPFMEPPRNICACGFVAKSAAGLKAHMRHC